jgi:hypothetical protein
MMQFSLSGQNRFTTQTKNFGPDPFNYWTHLACVYNTTNLCVYVNGTLKACSGQIGGLSFPYNPVTTLVGNTAVNGTAGLYGCLGAPSAHRSVCFASFSPSALLKTNLRSTITPCLAPS